MRAKAIHPLAVFPAVDFPARSRLKKAGSTSIDHEAIGRETPQLFFGQHGDAGSSGYVDLFGYEVHSDVSRRDVGDGGLHPIVEAIDDIDGVGRRASHEGKIRDGIDIHSQGGILDRWAGEQRAISLKDAGHRRSKSLLVGHEDVSGERIRRHANSRRPEDRGGDNLLCSSVHYGGQVSAEGNVKAIQDGIDGDGHRLVALHVDGADELTLPPR